MQNISNTINTIKDEIQEHVKSAVRHFEGEEEHASQTSTMQSLGNLDQTPKASKLSQFGLQLKQGVERQTNYIKWMLIRTFGEKCDPVRDNDQATKQQMTKIMAEIREQPKRGEKVYESDGLGQGKGVPLEDAFKSITQQDYMAPIYAKINEMRDRIVQYAPQWKEEAQQLVSNTCNYTYNQINQMKDKFMANFGERVNPSKDLDTNVREQLNRVNEDIRRLPHRDEEVYERQGQGKAE